jgi:hypothetical protein
MLERPPIRRWISRLLVGRWAKSLITASEVKDVAQGRRSTPRGAPQHQFLKFANSPLSRTTKPV